MKYATPSTSKTTTERPEELSDSEGHVEDTPLTDDLVENLNRADKMADDIPNSKSEGSGPDEEETDTNSIHQEEEESDSESDKEKESDELTEEMLRYFAVSSCLIPVPDD